MESLDLQVGQSLDGFPGASGRSELNISMGNIMHVGLAVVWPRLVAGGTSQCTLFIIYIIYCWFSGKHVGDTFTQQAVSLVYTPLPQALLTAMSVEVELGAFNLVLKNVQISYATAAIPDLEIEAGMRFSAGVTFAPLDNEATASFELIPSPISAAIALEFDGENINRVRVHAPHNEPGHA